MRKTAYILLTSVLFFAGASLALANISPAPSATTDPYPQFGFYCNPYLASFATGGFYEPTNNGICTTELTAQDLGSTNIFLAIYKGTPGDATLITFDNGPIPMTQSDPIAPFTTLQFQANNALTGTQGDNFFSVAVAYNDFNDVLAEDSAFETGGTPPLPYDVIPWTWGVAPGTPTTAPLTVTADNQTAAYGAPLPPLTATLSGFVNGDTATSSDVTGTANCTTTETPTSPVGTYPVTCDVGTLVSAANYTFDTFVPGTLTITQAPLTVTAANASMTYGGFMQILSALITGFVNGQTLATSGVTGSANCTTSALASSPAGIYPITCSAGTLVSQNYSFGTFFPGLFSIIQAPLTVTANNQTMAAGSVPPPLTATLSGFVNGDSATSNDITGGPTCSTGATSASPVGTYPITCSTGSLASNNYSFTTFVAGTLTVTPPPTLNCLWALATTGTGLQMSGSGSIKAAGCGMQINSASTGAVTLTGSATVTTPSNCIVGTVKKSGSGSLSTAPLASCTSKADPLASITKPTVPSTCNFTNYSQSGSSAVTLNPGVYCGGIKFSGSGKVTFNPGVYILKNGPLTVSGSAQLTGTGVSFFLTGTNAGVSASGSGSWHLTAPTGGLLAGFIFYLDGSSSGIAASSQFSGSSSLYLEGAVYLPKQTLQFSGSSDTSATSPLTEFIANAFQMSGSGAYNFHGSTSQTLVPVPAGLFVHN